MRAPIAILNPAARGGRARRNAAAIREALLPAFPGATWLLPESVEATIQAAATAETDQLVIAIGGDGTVNTVLRGLAQSDFRATLGVLPSGTGNDFAHAIGMPASLEGALRTLSTRRTEKVDVCMASVDGLTPVPFLNAVGIGFDAAASVRSRKRTYLPGFARYLISALETLASWDAPFATVTVDKSTTRLPIMFVTIGNGARSGGAFLITPDAQVDDGLFDVCTAHETGKGASLLLLPRVMRGSHVTSSAVRITQGVSVRVLLDTPTAVHADGEILATAARDIRADLLPGVLNVVR